MRYLLLLLIFTLLPACGMKNMPVPETPDQVAYAASAMYTATTNMAADLTRQGVISVEEAKEVQKKLSGHRKLVNSSIAMVRAGKELPKDRLERLNSLQSELMRMQRRLEQEKMEDGS